MLSLDHFAFGAAQLARGAEWMSEVLGAGPVGGGKHPLFGTHNALWRLETPAKPVYLEVIAIDRDAPPPARPRWFGLNDADVQSRFTDEPRLLTFVANTSDIAAARKQMPVDPGLPLDVSRDELVWQFSLPDDGRLIDNGALPYLIAWPPGVRPVDKMPNQNIHLLSVGGSRLGELEVNWPCPVTFTNVALEIELRSAHGETVSFSS